MSKDLRIEGQLDFFDMLDAYPGDSEATIRVSDPRNGVINRGESKTRFSVKDPVPFDKGDIETDSDGEISVKNAKSANVLKASSRTKKVEIETSDNDKLPIEEAIEARLKAYFEGEDTKPVKEPEKPIKEVKPTEEAKPTEEQSKPAEEAKPVTGNLKPQAKETSKKDKDFLYTKCEKCWCFDCKHNSVNEAKPRDMCGVMMACPACRSCEEQGFAEICVIGSAKEGCAVRALEEGIIDKNPYEFEDEGV